MGSSNCLSSTLFDRLLSSTRENPQPYYVQYKMDKVERTEVVEALVTRPQRSTLSLVFRELIANGIHEVFQLGPYFKEASRYPSENRIKPDMSHPNCSC